MYWGDLKKSNITVEVGREYSTDTMFAKNTRLRVDKVTGMVDVSVDLNPTLRTRAKGVGTYQDGKDLADDKLADFKSLTIGDRGIIQRIEQVLMGMGQANVPKLWRLHVALQGDYWFNVRPRFNEATGSLTFHVESVLTEHPPL